jgi:hypothetical protein
MLKSFLLMLVFFAINFSLNIFYMRTFKEETAPIVINVNFDKDSNGMLNFSSTDYNYLHREY